MQATQESPVELTGRSRSQPWVKVGQEHKKRQEVPGVRISKKRINRSLGDREVGQSKISRPRLYKSLDRKFTELVVQKSRISRKMRDRLLIHKEVQAFYHRQCRIEVYSTHSNRKLFFQFYINPKKPPKYQLFSRKFRESERRVTGFSNEARNLFTTQCPLCYPFNLWCGGGVACEIICLASYFALAAP